MVRNKDNAALIDALDVFETALATPVPPGDLEPWSQSLLAAARALKEPLERQIDEVHGRDLCQMEQDDLELVPRIKRLREHDARNLQEFQRLRSSIDALAKAAPAIEPDEKSVQNERADLVDDGLWFVISVRRQEVALHTWLMESLDRDRGTVD